MASSITESLSDNNDGIEACCHRTIVSISIPSARNHQAPSSTSILPRILLTRLPPQKSRHLDRRDRTKRSLYLKGLRRNTRIRIGVRVFSDNFPFPDATKAVREREKSLLTLPRFSRPSLPNHRACSRETAEGNGPTFNVNRHARLIRGRKVRERPKAEV